MKISSSRLVVIIQPLISGPLGGFTPPKAWWRELTLYILAHFEEDLERLGLYEAIRTTCYGIQMSVANFYAIFELYCLATGTFFTPVGELGMALH